jgi:hypothetical protein
LALAIAASPAAGAQCAPIANTGCPGSAAPACSGAPRIGTRLDVQCQNSCNRLQTWFLVVGTPLRPPILIGPPITCQSVRCQAGSNPLLFLLSATSVGYAIPNDANLIGLELCVQCGCLLPRPPCITLSKATRITIQR